MEKKKKKKKNLLEKGESLGHLKKTTSSVIYLIILLKSTNIFYSPVCEFNALIHVHISIKFTGIVYTIVYTRNH